MKTIKKITLAIFAIALCTAVTSCKKRGCDDPNADNFENDVQKSDNKTCKYRNAGSVTFKNIPSTNSSGNYWDSSPYSADPYFRFKPQSSGSWYETYIYYNATASAASVSQYSSSIKLTNEEWDWEIRDSDGYSVPSYNPLMASGTFNPLSGGSSSHILTVSGGGITIEVAYSISEN